VKIYKKVLNIISKDDLTKIEIGNSVKRIEQLFGMGIFSPDLNWKCVDKARQELAIEEMTNPLRKSVMIEILINLRNLLYKCESLCNKKIDFDEDVVKNKYKIEIKGKIQEKEIKDITDVVEYMRNAVCHNENDGYRWLSPWLYANSCFLYNKDDVFFQMGEQKLSVNKGIPRALEEAKRVLSKYLVGYNRRNEQRNFLNGVITNVKNKM